MFFKKNHLLDFPFLYWCLTWTLTSEKGSNTTNGHLWDWSLLVILTFFMKLPDKIFVGYVLFFRSQNKEHRCRAKEYYVVGIIQSITYIKLVLTSTFKKKKKKENVCWYCSVCMYLKQVREGDCVMTSYIQHASTIGLSNLYIGE